MTLTCPNCGNDRNFLVKTLQMHVVNVEGGRVEVSEESRPAVLEVLRRVRVRAQVRRVRGYAPQRSPADDRRALARAPLLHHPSSSGSSK